MEDLLQSSLAPTSRDTTTSHLLNLVMQFRKVGGYVVVVGVCTLFCVL